VAATSLLKLLAGGFRSETATWIQKKLFEKSVGTSRKPEAETMGNGRGHRHMCKMAVWGGDLGSKPRTGMLQHRAAAKTKKVGAAVSLKLMPLPLWVLGCQ
jgi:hypothetical protein